MWYVYVCGFSCLCFISFEYIILFAVQNEILRTQNEFCIKTHNIFERVMNRTRNCHHNDRIILVLQSPVHRPPFCGRFSHFCVLLHFSFNSTCHQRRFSELMRTSWNSLAFRLNENLCKEDVRQRRSMVLLSVRPMLTFAVLCASLRHPFYYFRVYTFMAERKIAIIRHVCKC